MAERPVRLFLPPQAPPPAETTPPPLVSLPRQPRCNQELCAGIAVLGHAGRIAVKVLITALGWTPGDRLTLAVADDAITLTRDSSGTSELDRRDQVIIPCHACRRVGIATGDRVLLVAMPTRDELMLHPMRVLSGLLIDYHRIRKGCSDDDQSRAD
jgi:bifunctional DNA-binding transcriptional regulator/antitoxin component of YhaV-PrlF toxin-antitoxin module